MTIDTNAPKPAPKPKKKSFWKKIGDGLNTVVSGVVQIVMAGKGGED